MWCFWQGCAVCRVLHLPCLGWAAVPFSLSWLFVPNIFFLNILHLLLNHICLTTSTTLKHTLLVQNDLLGCVSVVVFQSSCLFDRVVESERVCVRTAYFGIDQNVCCKWRLRTTCKEVPDSLSVKLSSMLARSTCEEERSLICETSTYHVVVCCVWFRTYSFLLNYVPGWQSTTHSHAHSFGS